MNTSGSSHHESSVDVSFCSTPPSVVDCPLVHMQPHLPKKAKKLKNRNNRAADLLGNSLQAEVVADAAIAATTTQAKRIEYVVIEVPKFQMQTFPVPCRCWHCVCGFTEPPSMTEWPDPQINQCNQQNWFPSDNRSCGTSCKSAEIREEWKCFDNESCIPSHAPDVPCKPIKVVSANKVVVNLDFVAVNPLQTTPPHEQCECDDETNLKRLAPAPLLCKSKFRNRRNQRN